MGHPEKTSPRSLREAVGRIGGGLGFDLIAVCSAEGFDRWGFYREWIQRGFAGSMGYLARRTEERKGPREILPSCQSVICVAQNYDAGPAPLPGRLEGWISRYAWGDDYHLEMKGRLFELMAALGDLGTDPVEGRVFVDTGPILEREVAMRAGLGFIGKNTCLISRKIGSWIFLGEILTSLEIAPDRPATPHCGSCTRCLQACPTKAFVGPYLLDATRCISYLTIEYRGPIPRELRALMGTHVFGCDICQAVCPWNRFARPTVDRSYHAREGLRAPDLIELMRLDLEGFRAMFRKSPVKRTKFVGLRRNVAVALGNSGAPEAVPVLRDALSDSEPLVRAHVVWALARIGTPEALGILGVHRDTERDSAVQEELDLALNPISGLE